MATSMVPSFTGRKRVRRDFGRIDEVAPMPNLIEVQKSSYDFFLQIGLPYLLPIPNYQIGQAVEQRSR